MSFVISAKLLTLAHEQDHDVRTEMAPSVLAYHLTRVINILGIMPLIRAIGA